MKVCCKWLASANGILATHAHESDQARRQQLGFGSTEDTRRLLETVQRYAAIVMGARTLIANLAEWLPLMRTGQHLWYIPTQFQQSYQHLLPVLQSCRVVWVSSAVPPGERDSYLPSSFAQLPVTICQDAHARGLNHLLVLGGAQIYQQFLDTHTVTDLEMTFSPLLLARGIPLQLRSTVQLELMEMTQYASEVYVSYRVLNSSIGSEPSGGVGSPG